MTECHWCHGEAQTLLLYGCLNQHYFEHGYCHKCVLAMNDLVMHCPQCMHFIAHSIALTLPKGHTPIGQFT